MSQQVDWRYCQTCHAIFYDGFDKKGVCTHSAPHQEQGYNFSLPYDLPETATQQASWRFCEKCYVMFYDGFPDKGHCLAGGAHVAQGYNFALPHDVAETSTAQSLWRYCEKCHSMFFDGYADKGHCPGGVALPPLRGGLPEFTGHVASGFTFQLPHDLPPPPPPTTVHFHADITFSDGTPVGGWVDVVVDASGNTTCSGHLHDSGAVGYSYTVVAFVVSPDLIAIGGDLLGNQGTIGGTFDTKSRDDDWMKVGFGQQIKDEWALHNFPASTFHTLVKVSDDVTPTVVTLFNTALTSFATEFGKKIADTIFPTAAGSGGGS